eukprot:4758606-Pyramimonas_sp.AAC.1
MLRHLGAVQIFKLSRAGGGPDSSDVVVAQLQAVTGAGELPLRCWPSSPLTAPRAPRRVPGNFSSNGSNSEPTNQGVRAPVGNIWQSIVGR